MSFESSSFLQPYSLYDRLIQIINTSNEVIYSISPCDIERVYVLNGYLKIKTTGDNLSIKFESTADASLALGILETRINEIKGVFPCDSVTIETYSAPTSTIFSSDTFLTQYVDGTKKVQIKNTLGSIVFSFNPCDVIAYNETKFINIQSIANDNITRLEFISLSDATTALNRLEERTDLIKAEFPCESILPDPYVPPITQPNSNSVFSSDNFLTQYVTGTKKVQIRNTLGDYIFSIDPCNVVLVYTKEGSKFVNIKSIGNDNILKLEFLSITDASIASNKLQSRIDHIKGIYPCGGGGFAPGFEGLTFYQFTASATWSFNHDLGRTPSVALFNFDGYEIGGLVRSGYSSVNIYFNAGLTGSIYLI
jgi:hypothetical protein